MLNKRGTPGRLLVCTDFFNCSLPTRKQTLDHLRSYHDPEPFLFCNSDPSQPSVYIHRNLNQGMLLTCSHPDCDHATISTWDAEQHYRTCQILHAGHLAVTTTIAAVTDGRMEHPMQLECQSHLQSPHVPQSRYYEKYPPSLSPSFTSRSSQKFCIWTLILAVLLPDPHLLSQPWPT